MIKDTKTNFDINYSYQKTSTDTIAVDLENNPFRNKDGSLLFRPGGHGALIENLNEQDADVIFVKNIDNVVVGEVINDVADSKKILAGALLNVQRKAFEYAKSMDSERPSGNDILKIKKFLIESLNVRFDENYDALAIEQQLEILKDKINRPIRICGMVKNEGEPGGGPFWIKDMQGHKSLQIIESVQIDMENQNQVDLLKNATHFNPVDLVCGVKKL